MIDKPTFTYIFNSPLFILYFLASKLFLDSILLYLLLFFAKPKFHPV